MPNANGWGMNLIIEDRQDDPGNEIADRLPNALPRVPDPPTAAHKAHPRLHD